MIRIFTMASLVAVCAVCLCSGMLCVAAYAQQPIDPVRGRALMQKASRGDQLTAEEQAYLERVRQAIRERAAGMRPGSGPPQPQPPAAVDPNEWKPRIAMTDMKVPYLGQDGGLYGGWTNDPPAAHRAAALQEAGHVLPRDAEGQPAADGRVGFVTIGFSNPSIESEHFIRAAQADSQRSEAVVMVNGCIGGRSAVMWAWDGADVLSAAEQERLDQAMDTVRMPKGPRRPSGQEKDTWPTLAQRVADARLSPLQVQVAWLKHVEANPKPFGAFPDHARQLQRDITAILRIARHHYPNLRLVFLSSRTFGGWSGRASGSPEPYAYESGFGTRWVIQAQIEGATDLNYDRVRGDVQAPLVLWGPYLWARGDVANENGLIWTQQDVRPDQLHPNENGCAKTTALLLNFFKSNEATRTWFLKEGETARLTPLPLE